MELQAEGSPTSPGPPSPPRLEELGCASRDYFYLRGGNECKRKGCIENAVTLLRIHCQNPVELSFTDEMPLSPSPPSAPPLEDLSADVRAYFSMCGSNECRRKDYHCWARCQKWAGLAFNEEPPSSPVPPLPPPLLELSSDVRAYYCGCISDGSARKDDVGRPAGRWGICRSDEEQSLYPTNRLSPVLEGSKSTMPAEYCELGTNGKREENDMEELLVRQGALCQEFSGSSTGEKSCKSPGPPLPTSRQGLRPADRAYFSPRDGNEFRSEDSVEDRVECREAFCQKSFGLHIAEGTPSAPGPSLPPPAEELSSAVRGYMRRRQSDMNGENDGVKEAIKCSREWRQTSLKLPSPRKQPSSPAPPLHSPLREQSLDMRTYYCGPDSTGCRGKDDLEKGIKCCQECHRISGCLFSTQNPPTSPGPPPPPPLEELSSAVREYYCRRANNRCGWKEDVEETANPPVISRQTSAGLPSTDEPLPSPVRPHSPPLELLNLNGQACFCGNDGPGSVRNDGVKQPVSRDVVCRQNRLRLPSVLKAPSSPAPPPPPPVQELSSDIRAYFYGGGSNECSRKDGVLKPVKRCRANNQNIVPLASADVPHLSPAPSPPSPPEELSLFVRTYFRQRGCNRDMRKNVAERPVKCGWMRSQNSVELSPGGEITICEGQHPTTPLKVLSSAALGSHCGCPLSTKKNQTRTVRCRMVWSQIIGGLSSPEDLHPSPGPSPSPSIEELSSAVREYYCRHDGNGICIP